MPREESLNAVLDRPVVGPSSAASQNSQPSTQLRTADQDREHSLSMVELERRVSELAAKQLGSGNLDNNQIVRELETLLGKAGREFNLSFEDFQSLRELHAREVTRGLEQREQEEARRTQETMRHAEELARKNAAQPFDPNKTREQIDADINALRAEFSGSGPQFARVVDRYIEVREEVRKKALMSELEQAAREQARKDFDADPASGPGQQTARRISEIMTRYADIQDREFLNKTATERFQNIYSQRREYLYDNELNWIQRRWYDAKSLCSSAWSAVTGAVGAVVDGIGNAASALYEGAKAVVILAKDAVVGVATVAKDLAVAGFDLVTNPDTYQAIWNAGVSVVSGIGSAISATYNFLTDGATWTAVGNGFTAAFNFITAESTWNAVGNGLSKAWDFATSKETWKTIGNTALAVGAAILDPRNLLSVAKGALHVITHPIESLQKAWAATEGVRTFLKQMSDSIGLTDLAVGAWHLIKTPYVAAAETIKGLINSAADFSMVLTGQMTAQQFGERLRNNITNAFKTTGECLAEGLRAIKGGVLLMGEVTGVTDAVLCVACALRGDWVGAGMHGAFALMSAGTIAATVATAGAAAPALVAVIAGRSSMKAAATQILKAGSREFLEHAAESLGKEAIQGMEKRLGEALAKETGQQLSPEAAQSMGREILQRNLREGAVEIAERGSRELAECVTREGSQALTGEAVRSVMRDRSAEVTERILREAGLVDSVKDATLKMLTEMSGKSVKEVQELLIKEGICDAKNAKAVAKEIVKKLKSGRADSAIKDILEEGISKQVKEYVEESMEKPFKNTFRATLRGEVAEEYSQVLSKAAKEQAERLGKQVDEFVDELVEEGWKGVREGIESAVRKLVREGLDAAFKEFRGHHLKMIRPRMAAARLGGKEVIQDSGESVASVDKKEHIDQVAERRAELQGMDRESFRIVNERISGSDYVVRYEQLKTGEWIRVSERLVHGPDEKLEDKKNRAA